MEGWLIIVDCGGWMKLVRVIIAPNPPQNFSVEDRRKIGFLLAMEADEAISCLPMHHSRDGEEEGVMHLSSSWLLTEKSFSIKIEVNDHRNLWDVTWSMVHDLYLPTLCPFSCSLRRINSPPRTPKVPEKLLQSLFFFLFRFHEHTHTYIYKPSPMMAISEDSL